MVEKALVVVCWAGLVLVVGRLGWTALGDTARRWMGAEPSSRLHSWQMSQARQYRMQESAREMVEAWRVWRRGGSEARLSRAAERLDRTLASRGRH